MYTLDLFSYTWLHTYYSEAISHKDIFIPSFGLPILYRSGNLTKIHFSSWPIPNKYCQQSTTFMVLLKLNLLHAIVGFSFFRKYSTTTFALYTYSMQFKDSHTSWWNFVCQLYKKQANHISSRFQSKLALGQASAWDRKPLQKFKEQMIRSLP